MFLVGVAIQVGSFVGATVMFVLVYGTNIFTDEHC